ncbi:cell division protein FtsL [Marinisporobacter balticus]|uniref:Cell division protein FtsL n=1 Tax=Marinisporobacter balticus TaxID=2018667 RepID=A0A4R2KZF4_9FIRM|nr:cell division protein FtsL [Marinisporobacter balticus]TCO79313.1 cell division protein FtsL [Marinisporobacter balticus]
MVVAQRKYNYLEEEAIYQPPKKNNANKHKESKKIKTIHKVQMILSIIIIASLCIGILLGYVKVSELKYKVNGLNKEIEQLEGVAENLRVDVEGIKRSDIIEKSAKEELGMQYPEKTQMVFLSVDNSKMPKSANAKEKAKLEKEKKTSIIAGIKGTVHKLFTLLD